VALTPNPSTRFLPDGDTLVVGGIAFRGRGPAAYSMTGRKVIGAPIEEAEPPADSTWQCPRILHSAGAHAVGLARVTSRAVPPTTRRVALCTPVFRGAIRDTAHIWPGVGVGPGFAPVFACDTGAVELPPALDTLRQPTPPAIAGVRIQYCVH